MKLQKTKKLKLDNKKYLLQREMIAKKHALLKDVYNRKPVYINNELYDLYGFKIKNKKELDFLVSGFIDIYEKNVYFYFPNKNIFLSNLNFESDLICLNNNFKIIEIFKNFLPKQILSTKQNIDFLVITKKGFVDYYQLKIGDHISTNPLYKNR